VKEENRLRRRMRDYGSRVLRKIWEWGAKEDMGVGC